MKKATTSLTTTDLVAAVTRFPRAVICLVSALSWHDLTTQIPRRIDLAVERNARLPRQGYPPVRGYRFSGPRFTSGIERQELHAFEFKVYSPEKTLADCFAFRHKLGMDLFLEAMTRYTQNQPAKCSRLVEFARCCRVEKQIQPFLEAFSS